MAILEHQTIKVIKELGRGKSYLYLIFCEQQGYLVTLLLIIEGLHPEFPPPPQKEPFDWPTINIFVT
jgi:hypothetical protein